MSVTEMIGEIKNPIKTIIRFNFHSCPTKNFLTCSYNSFVHTLEFWKAIKPIFKRLQKLWNRARKIFRGRLETRWVATLLRLGEGNDWKFFSMQLPKTAAASTYAWASCRRSSPLLMQSLDGMNCNGCVNGTRVWFKGCKCITSTRSNHSWSNSWCDLQSIASVSRNFDALNNLLI